ncbi:hypothetical protein ASA1KI_34300 [Opitutales bacterium ASA1]|nr:hypothetical protein ASA1KI_34300 [Opitutales bacterium ASA1]
MLDQLRQGTSPGRLAASIAAGTVCSVLPFIGLTTLFNLVVAAVARLNQPIMQVLNQLLTPVQLVLILVYVRIGERLWGAHPLSFSVSDVVSTFREASLSEFFARFGMAGLHALTAWTITAPVVFGVVWFATAPLLRRFAVRGLEGKASS